MFKNKHFDKYIIKNTKTELIVSLQILANRKDHAELTQILFDTGWYHQPSYINTNVERWYK